MKGKFIMTKYDSLRIYVLALLKVHLSAKYGQLGFLVDEDGHPILVHNLILGLFGLGIVKSVTQT